MCFKRRDGDTKKEVFLVDVVAPEKHWTQFNSHKGAIWLELIDHSRQIKSSIGSETLANVMLLSWEFIIRKSNRRMGVNTKTTINIAVNVTK